MIKQMTKISNDKEFDLLGHTTQQFRRAQNAEAQTAEIVKKLDAIEEKRRRIRERQKAAERDKRVLKSSTETGKGALAANILLKAIGEPGNSAILDLVDEVLAMHESPEAEQVKALCGIKVVTIRALGAWLDVDIARPELPVEQLVNDHDIIWG
jgi:uncharacterized protein YyaL (SSP411 family)